jgi:two-component system LytT family response regulator
MKKIRTLVVDDEPLARRRILRLLQDIDDIQVIGEGTNGREALRLIGDYQPDLVFLDIQMPDFNGFDVLAKAGGDHLPFIIFVTAYDQYALQAFDVHAVDYLLKPYDDERFLRALDHARRQIRLKEDNFLHHKMLRLLDDYRQRGSGGADFIVVSEKGVDQHLPIDEIQYIEAHGNYLKIHLQQRAHLLRATLQSMTEQIDRPYFLRIHRSVFLNTHYIDRIHYTGNNQYCFRLKNEDEVHSSRSYKADIERFLQDEHIRRKLEE